MTWSKFSSSSFLSVAHILIISGRVPKIDITFIRVFRTGCVERWLRNPVSRRGRRKNRNLGQGKYHPAAFGQIARISFANFVEEAPGEDQEIVRSIAAIEDRAGENLEMRFRRAIARLRRRVVDHVVKMT